MSQARIVIIVIALCLMVAAGFVIQAHTHATLPEAKVILPHDATTFPFTLADGRPIVPVRINGKGPYPFILDTAAEGTILSEKLSDELDLAVLGTAKAGSPGAAVLASAKLVRIDKLELGGLTMLEAPAVALDLAALPQVFSSPGAPVGALSIRHLEGLLVTLDYSGQAIHIQRGNLPAANNSTIFDFGANDRLPSLMIDVAGTPLRVNLDSGSPHGLVLPQNLASKLPLEAPPVPAPNLHTVSGEQHASNAKLLGPLKIGEYSVDSPEVLFVDEFPVGNLGALILQRFTITLDWQTHRIQIADPAVIRGALGGGAPSQSHSHPDNPPLAFRGLVLESCSFGTKTSF